MLDPHQDPMQNQLITVGTLNKEGTLPRESASRQVQRLARSLDAMLRSGVVLNLFRVLKKISSLDRLTKKNEGDGVKKTKREKTVRDEREKGRREKMQMQDRRKKDTNTERRIKKVPHGKRGGKKNLPGSLLVKKGHVVGLHKGLKRAPHVVGTRVAPPRRLAVEIPYNKHMTHCPCGSRKITIILDQEHRFLCSKDPSYKL
jgi:hypothetical protein